MQIADDTTKTTNNDRVLFVTSKITNLHQLQQYYYVTLSPPAIEPFPDLN